ncbi:MAG: hypothetical protein P4L11_10965 [Geothrix sp.]|jgi:hypothetical protein|nr:hypothetical protein [Geothrix sp.]
MNRALLFPLLAAPLLAQYSASDRLNSTSVGIGASDQGLMVTCMWTGPSYGIFGGFSRSFDNGSNGTGMTQGTGAPSWIQSKGPTSEMHVGMAYRLDSRWVLGLGAGFSVQAYDYTLNPGSPSYFGPVSNQLGPPSETKFGPVAMADVRIGTNWGLELLAGSTVVGASITYRF